MIGIPELLIILAIVVLVFGIGRVGKIGGELGQAVSNFRSGIASSEDKTKNETTPTSTQV